MPEWNDDLTREAHSLLAEFRVYGITLRFQEAYDAVVVEAVEEAWAEKVAPATGGTDTRILHSPQRPPR